MYNPHKGQTIQFLYHGEVKSGVVTRVNAKTVSLHNGYRVPPVFILDPVLPLADAINAVSATLNGTDKNLVIGDTVKFINCSLEGQTGTIVGKLTKNYRVKLANGQYSRVAPSLMVKA